MDTHSINQLDEFLSDVGFPVDKQSLVQECREFPLSENIREAIALLPDKEYASRSEVKSELIGVPFDDGIPKKDLDIGGTEEVDDKMDAPAALDEFTQLGDEEDHESV